MTTLKTLFSNRRSNSVKSLTDNSKLSNFNSNVLGEMYDTVFFLIFAFYFFQSYSYCITSIIKSQYHKNNKNSFVVFLTCFNLLFSVNKKIIQKNEKKY